MTSRWAAVGAETDLLRRARQLQKSWERLLADGALGNELPPGATAGLRPRIVESWRRSLATGLDPTDSLAPIEADESEVLERWFEHPLGSLTHVVAEQLRKVAEESRSVVVVTDASGLVLHRVGEEGLKERAAEQNHLVEGARWSEAADGTNGIGTALAADHAFQVFAFEHFNERHHQWVCSGAPVHDPVSGQTIGLIDLSSLWKIAHPRSLELVTTAASAIEQCLVDVRRDRDARLRRRYSDLMTKSTDLLVDRDGYLFDGAKVAHPRRPFDIPEGGGDVVLGDGSVAVAVPLGRGEAYLLRHGTTRRATSVPAKELELAEDRARKLATEQAALRQVATLVARDSSPDRLFAVVTEQVARIIDVPHVRLVHYQPDSSVVVGGFSEGDREPFPLGSRWALDSPGVIATVRQTGRPARVEDYEQLTGEVAAVVRDAGMCSAVASPIVVERRLWGAMVVLSPQGKPLPDDTEARLADFTELVATAIANSESRVAIGRLLEEQAALRRVATLVAGGTGAGDLFAAVADEVQQLLGAQVSAIVRFEDDGTGVTVGTHGGPYAAGTRTELDPHFVVATVRRTRLAARFDTDDPAAADMPAIVRGLGIRSAVASPIVVEGEMWGTIVIAARGSLPQESEARLGDFTDLVGTAVANTQARQEVTALADEQAALRRVATVVAQEASHAQVVSTIARETGELLGLELVRVVRYEVDGTAVVVAGSGVAEDLFPVGSRTRPEVDSATSRVFRTGEPVRLDDYETASDTMTQAVRSAGVRGVVATPIWVEGRLWGAMTAGTTLAEPLPPDTEARLGQFTELMRTAIANAESREARAVVTEEQAALRHVATLVAEAAPPAEIFSTVSNEVAKLFRTEMVVVGRFDGDPAELLVVGVGDGTDEPVVGSRWKLDEALASTAVYHTGLAARFDHESSIADPEVAGVVERFRPLATVAVPIKVEGRLWGAMIVSTRHAMLPTDTEDRLQRFTDLIATAIANAAARAEVHRLAEEQAALRRVATLVARGAQPREVFWAVSDEVGRLFGTQLAAVGRFVTDGRELDLVGAGQTHERWEVADFLASAEVWRTGRSARADAPDWESTKGETAERLRSLGIVSTVASPIVVEGELWGAMLVASTDAQLPVDTEERLDKFTELVSTAIANSQAREQVAELADEQAALRRVATLVAQDAAAGQIFAAVSAEVDRVFGLDPATFDVAVVGRFDPGPELVIVGVSKSVDVVPLGSRWPLDDLFAPTHVFRTRRSARIRADDLVSASGDVADFLRHHGYLSQVACPIVVDGRLWGAMSVNARIDFPPDTEERLERFTELVATAIANAESSAELAASRRRIVAASDDARRRIERDLHDGVQQQLVSLGLELGVMKADPPTGNALKEQLDIATEDVRSVLDSLVQIARGIHPAILSQGGLVAALRALARRSAVPVELHTQVDGPLPDEVEVAAYYAVAEALTNAAKHARASFVHMDVTTDDGTLTLIVRDDGVGGADPGAGSGLVGLQDRVEALGGTITIDSSPGSGTSVVVTLPTATRQDQEI